MRGDEGQETGRERRNSNEGESAVNFKCFIIDIQEDPINDA
jgi:hypothetical protein